MAKGRSKNRVANTVPPDPTPRQLMVAIMNPSNTKSEEDCIVSRYCRPQHAPEQQHVRPSGASEALGRWHFLGHWFDCLVRLVWGSVFHILHIFHVFCVFHIFSVFRVIYCGVIIESKELQEGAKVECTICLELIEPEAACRLPCGHDTFHVDCASEWYYTQKRPERCPLCRARMQPVGRWNMEFIKT
ncbi:hypothetical protein B0J18DRAFT_430896 [Chaetomium sp. MPI-SDFR-AT-0129]|nr:hypothetical protein B0J18DRAFT_430896 [Chaetomium sp. MPI-SDFR-AT-0129]